MVALDSCCIIRSFCFLGFLVQKLCRRGNSGYFCTDLFRVQHTSNNLGYNYTDYTSHDF